MRRLIVLAAGVLLVTAMLAGCGGGTTPGASPTPTQPGQSAAPARSPSPANSGDTFASIVDAGAGVRSVSYDMITTDTDGKQLTMKVWLKDTTKMRQDMTMEDTTTVFLFDLAAGTGYTYYPAQNMAMKIDMSLAKKPASAGSVEQNNPTVLGTETMDGKVCLVVQYSAEGATIKEWFWKEKGFPVRMESTTSAGTVIFEYKNIDFSSIPDSTFELPAGVQIVTIP